MNTREKFAFGGSFVVGFLVCLAISHFGGRKEAWDSPMYFVIGIPLMALAAFLIARKLPDRSWRWPLTMAFGQSLALSLGGGSLSLWPLAMIAMCICSIPQFVAGWLGARTSV